MAENPRKLSEQPKTTELETEVGMSFDFDKELRLRHLKDRQNDERQRKLEEIKAQALAAQVFKEQKEQERRKRLDDLKCRDDERRLQVEERKKQIQEAERDRLEFILRRNQEREQRFESRRRNERSNAVFAFGSSTPRMLDPNDVTASYWNTRRATSIQNIVTSTNPSLLTRRQSERELDAGTKKRATSATGLERTGESNAPTIPAGCVSGYTGRRRTDLVPTIPAKDFISSSRKSLNQSPGRAYSMTRLDQLAKPRKRHDLKSLTETNSFRPLSSSYHSSVTRSMSHLAVSKSGPSPTRRELNKADSRSMQQLTEKSISLPRTTRTSQLREQKLITSSNCSEASSRPSSSLSQQSTTSLASSASVRHRLTTAPRKPRPVSIAVTGISTDAKGDNKPPLPKTKKLLAKPTTSENVVLKSKTKTRVDSSSNNTTKVNKSEKPQVAIAPPKPETHVPTEPKLVTGDIESNVHVPQTTKSDLESPQVKKLEKDNDKTEPILVDLEDKQDVREKDKKDVGEKDKKDVIEKDKKDVIEKDKKDVLEIETVKVSEPETSDTNVTEIQKSEQVQLSIDESHTSPEVEIRSVIERPEPVLQEKPVEPKKPEPTSEAQIVVDGNTIENIENEMTTSMTKVRINTEEEAKAALAERRRLIREEAERQAELERLRIEAEAKAELERQQREEEQIRELIELQRQTEQERLQEAIKETQRREEEEKLKKEEELRLKLLKEEAEKKAKEDAEKQKAELKERLKNEEKEREARRKRVEAIMSRTRGKNATSQSVDENKSDDIKSEVEDKINGTKIEEQENGTTKLSKDVVNNVIPSDLIKNAITIESMDSNDSINSNNTWRDNQQYDSLMQETNTIRLQ
uniref:MAP7 domain-containing protein 2-like n=1 Tax=Diabrotica virgifera virgifera TaxID=50390 RepID=A0A6P7H2H7_DIAVI